MIEAVPMSRCRFRNASVKNQLMHKLSFSSCWSLSVSSELANTK